MFGHQYGNEISRNWSTSSRHFQTGIEAAVVTGIALIVSKLHTKWYVPTDACVPQSPSDQILLWINGRFFSTFFAIYLPFDAVWPQLLSASLNILYLIKYLAEHSGRPEAWAVFAPSDTGVMGSNPTRGMDVCVCVYSVCR
jgi:hypothetical protein